MYSNARPLRVGDEVSTKWAGWVVEPSSQESNWPTGSIGLIYIYIYIMGWNLQKPSENPPLRHVAARDTKH